MGGGRTKIMEFDVYKIVDGLADVKELSVARSWMDQTKDSHAYRCLPLSTVNNLGWGVYYNEDISFIWNGNENNPTKFDIEIISGNKYVYLDRNNKMVTFMTGLMFRTPENYSLLVQPVPNQFIDGVEALSAILSTSFLKGDLHPSLRVNKANQVITIPAGTPIVSVIPINLNEINNSVLNVKSGSLLEENEKNNDPEYSEYVIASQKKGIWSDFYRNGTDHKGNIIGRHQVKRIDLRTIREDNV